MNTYTDTQLLACLEKMAERKTLPEGELHLCWWVESHLRLDEQADLYMTLYGDDFGHGDQRDCLINLGHATWQQRTIALAKVKGVEIV